MINEVLGLDLKKLKDEDKRFLLTQSLDRAIFNSQKSFSNATLLISLLAIFLSLFSIIYQTEDIFLILHFCLISEISLLFFLSRFKKARSSLDNELVNLKFNYDELFRYHFDYAKKS
ncbi:MAG: hypothetical protein WC511_04475 [Candidatus Pacearchaeota archaeon]